MSRKRSNEDFIAQMQIINPSIILNGMYQNRNTIINCQCSVCSYEWTTTANSLLNKHGCLLCARKRITDSSRKKHDTFIKELSAINPNVEIRSNYEACNKKVECFCKICNNTWQATPTSLLRNKHGCPECVKKERIKRLTSFKHCLPPLSHEEFCERMKKINTNIVFLSNYNLSNERIKCKCTIDDCNHEWEALPYNLIHRRSGCPNCARKNKGQSKKLSLETVINRLADINPYIDIIGTYVNTSTPVTLKCKLCNHEWDSRVADTLHGVGCPKCNHTGTSFVEQFILLSLKKVLGDKKVLSRDRSTIGLELDILIPEYSFAIESGSWNYHKMSYDNRDLKKRKLCAQKGIRLITIYDSFKSEEDISFPEDVHTFPFNLSNSNKFPRLIKLAITIFELLKIECTFNDQDWSRIRHGAYIKSRTMTTENFVRIQQEKNPKVTLVGEYLGSHVKTLFKCNNINCTHEWYATPEKILMRRACPKCYGKPKKTHEKFLEELKCKHPNVIVKGKYVNSHTPLPVECAICGYEWNPTPKNLLHDHGCSVCNSSIIRVQNITTGEVFKSITDAVNIFNEYGASISGISRCCKGKQKSCGGFKWRYYE